MTNHPSRGRGQGHMTHVSCLRNGLSESRQILSAGRIYQVLAFGWQTTSIVRIQGYFTRF